MYVFLIFIILSAKSKKMNRLIIVGNGFDKAHGMETSYNDFLFSYLKSSILECSTTWKYEDPLIKLSKHNDQYGYHKFDLSKLQNVSDFKQFYVGPTSVAVAFGYASPKELKDYRLIFKCKMLENIFNSSCYYHWVDIENEYYSMVLEIFEKKNKNLEKEKSIKELNNEFKYLAGKLEEYLSGIELPEINTNTLALFKSKIDKNEVLVKEMKASIKPSFNHILNFNYTKTVEKYVTKISESSNDVYNVNYIHGELNESSNPIIFGFGDEVDKYYSMLEDSKISGVFDYIKSFWYLRTTNLHNLIKFINSNEYQIYILGHSCGLSDRTLLKMLFEHENCISIKIYYHKKEHDNNFINLTEQIARHFVDKGEMRKKVVPLPLSSPLPQSS